MLLTNRTTKIAGLMLAAFSLSALVACSGGGAASSNGSSDDTTTTDDTTTYPDTTQVIDNSVTVVESDPTSGGYDGGYDDGGGYDDSSSGCDDSGCNSFTNGGTKDTMLQRAKAQNISAQDRANGLADRFDMSYQSAYQLSQLADQVKAMSVQGQLTDKDQQAIAASAFAIGGVSTDEVKDAMDSFKNGDKSKAEALMDKAASKMGMSSSAQLRDQILPSVGVKF